MEVCGRLKRFLSRFYNRQDRIQGTGGGAQGCGRRSGVPLSLYDSRPTLAKCIASFSFLVIIVG